MLNLSQGNVKLVVVNRDFELTGFEFADRNGVKFKENWILLESTSFESAVGF